MFYVKNRIKHVFTTISHQLQQRKGNPTNQKRTLHQREKAFTSGENQLVLPHKFIRELDFRPALKLLW